MTEDEVENVKLQMSKLDDLTLSNYSKEVELVSNDKSKRVFYTEKHLGYIPINKSLTPTSK